MLLCSLGVASAQTTLKSAYFMDRMTTRHKINPALMSEYGYFALPALGDINVGINSNLSVDKLVFPLDNGDLGLFAHPDVDSSEFLSGLKDDNVISQELNLTLLSMGFYGFGGYNTIDLSVRETLDINIKKSLFEFLVGSDSGNSVYDMAGTSVDLNSWAELSFGHAHRINDHLTIGVKLKYLMGAATANVEIDKMTFESTSDHILIDAHASGPAAMVGMQLSGLMDDISFDTFDMASISNSGFAVDFGATYELNKFNFAIAMTDLGYINWTNPSTVETGVSSYFGGFENADLDNFDESTEDQLNDFTSPFEEIEDITFSPTDAYRTSLYAKLNIAAEYQICKTLSAGVLYTSTFGPTTTTELMLAATYSPATWFDIALSGTTSSYGTYWGWALNFCPRAINFFIGMDRMVASITPQGVPYSSSNLNLKMGLSIPLGKIHTAN